MKKYAMISDDEQNAGPQVPLEDISRQLCVGDIVFIRSRARPFIKVADATNSWTNHVGIVMEAGCGEPLIAESTFPFSKATSFSHFVARSENQRVGICRLNLALSDAERERLREAAKKRFGIFYDCGFNIQSSRQFCSRYVYEVLVEATAVQVGEVEDFASLFGHNPQADLKFWKVWFFGRIPWQRRTITPASLLRSPQVREVLDARAV